MEKFVWKEEYSMGIPSIDEQHQHFFGITNQIIDLVEGGNPAREEIFSMAEKLGNYALYHLKTEEDYFDELSYPSAPDHVAAHNLYREQVAHYLEALRGAEGDTKELAEEIASYSIHWLSDHILLVDKKYTVFFREHGVH